MGRQLIITGLKLTDLSAPKLVVTDPIESAGSLLLLDATHPTGAWPAGVGASGSALRNVLWEKAKAVYGAGTEASLAASLSHAGMSGANGLLERSSKGGLHGLVSQSAGLVSAVNTPYARISFDIELRKWLFNHPDNDLYISVWGRITRGYKSGAIDGTYTNDAASALIELNQGSGSQRFALGQKAALMNTLGSMNNNNSEKVAGPQFMNAASGGWSAAPATEPAIQTGLVCFGNAGSNNTYTSAPMAVKSRWPSWIVYRVYVEDLTVSGRTYQQVHDIDYAQYQKHVLTAGGRYYGDTFTDPAALP